MLEYVQVIERAMDRTKREVSVGLVRLLGNYSNGLVKGSLLVMRDSPGLISGYIK